MKERILIIVVSFIIVLLVVVIGTKPNFIYNIKKSQKSSIKLKSLSCEVKLRICQKESFTYKGLIIAPVKKDYWTISWQDGDKIQPQASEAKRAEMEGRLLR